MSRFLEKVGVSIASRLGITVGIAAIVAALVGGGYWWVKTQAPRDTVKDKESGLKLDVEQLSFYGAKDSLILGTVYRPSEILDEKLPCIIYVQDKSYGESWCRSLAGTGAVAYCFDFKGDGEKARVKDLEAVLKGIRNLRHVDPDKIYLLGEANGCLTACNVAFDNPKKIKGLILVSPGFNPLEISRKAKRYSGTILVVDDAKGRKANIEEIKDYID
jgi:predicted peptidase